MFRHYHIILRELVINTLSSYTIISKAADYKLPEDDTMVSKHVVV